MASGDQPLGGAALQGKRSGAHPLRAATGVVWHSNQSTHMTSLPFEGGHQPAARKPDRLKDFLRVRQPVGRRTLHRERQFRSTARGVAAQVGEVYPRQRTTRPNATSRRWRVGRRSTSTRHARPASPPWRGGHSRTCRSQLRAASRRRGTRQTRESTPVTFRSFMRRGRSKLKSVSATRLQFAEGAAGVYGSLAIRAEHTQTATAAARSRIIGVRQKRRR